MSQRPSGALDRAQHPGATAFYLALFVTLAGMIIARRRPGIVEVKIPVADLPEALHGFSIAQISDVHVGPTIKRGFVEASSSGSMLWMPI